MQASQNSSDSIPSISFSNLLWMFFGALARFARHVIRFLFRHWLFLVLCLVAGIITGVVLSRLIPPLYSLSMVVKQTELNARTFGAMINELDKMASSGSGAEMSRVLGIPEPIAGQLKSIDGRNLQGQSMDQDTAQQVNRNFVIEMTVQDNRVADTLQQAVLRYFNDNPYLSKLKQDLEQVKRDRLAFIQQELDKLDSLKNQYNRSLANTGNRAMFYNNAFNPVDLYERSAEYHEEKMELETWLRQYRQSVVQIDGVKPVVVPRSMGTVSYALTVGLLFFFVGCLLLALRAVVSGK